MSHFKIKILFCHLPCRFKKWGELRPHIFCKLRCQYHAYCNTVDEPVKIDFPFEVEDVENVEMYHYDGVPESAEKKVVVAENDIKTLYLSLIHISTGRDFTKSTS